MSEIDGEIDFYEKWLEGSRRIQDIIELDGESVKLGNNDDVIIIEDEIELNTTFRELSRIMNHLEDDLDHLKSSWKDNVEKIEKINLEYNEKKDSNRVTEFLNRRKEILSLVDDVSRWIKKFNKNGLKPENRDIPFDELKKLAEIFSKDGRKPIKILVKI